MCRNCAVTRPPQAGELPPDFYAGEDGLIAEAVGCRECRNTGYHGRRAIFEWMDSSSEIRSLILKNASTDAIRNSACRAGMKTLAEDGRRLVEEGITTIEEVLSVTTVHEMETTEATAPATAAAHAPEPTLPRALL